MGLVWGMKDPILGRALKRHQEAFPRATVRRSEEAGHFLQEEVPELVAHPVRYRGRRAAWRLARALPPSLSMAPLPQAVEDVAWDVILVDAPRGTRWYRRGRLGSIRTAARLALVSGADVFVHDCHRKLERECSDHCLGRDRLHTQVGSMRHYRLG